VVVRVDGDDVGPVAEMGGCCDGQGMAVQIEHGDPAAFAGNVEPTGGGVVGPDVGILTYACGAISPTARDGKPGPGPLGLPQPAIITAAHCRHVEISIQVAGGAGLAVSDSFSRDAGR
jgi:hypothetical protein